MTYSIAATLKESERRETWDLLHGSSVFNIIFKYWYFRGLKRFVNTNIELLSKMVSQRMKILIIVRKKLIIYVIPKCTTSNHSFINFNYLYTIYGYYYIKRSVRSILSFMLLQYQSLPTAYQILQIFIKNELKKNFLLTVINKFY